MSVAINYRTFIACVDGQWMVSVVVRTPFEERTYEGPAESEADAERKLAELRTLIGVAS